MYLQFAAYLVLSSRSGFAIMGGLKKIQTKRNDRAGFRQVSSSRRQPFSFKKATEVYAICSLETALIIFGPGGIFYNPRIDAFLRGLVQPKKADSISKKHHAERETTLLELNKQYAEARAELKATKRREEELRKLRENEITRLMSRPISELNLEEMIRLKTFLEGLEVKILNRIADLSVKPSGSAESSSAIVVEPAEHSASNPSGGSGSADMDGNDVVHKKN